MSRSKRAKKRNIEGDPIYGNRLVARLINRVMKQGKKTVAQKQVYKALEIIKEKTKKDPTEIMRDSLEKIKPTMEVRPRRVGGTVYQVPVPVKGDRKEALAIRWLVMSARKRPNKNYHTYAEKLAAELLDALKGEGETIKKRDDTHKMADANRAFAHFRW
jgi:small subunit ribosomal protein S7